MRFDPRLSKEEYIAGLTQEAEQAYGAERVPELKSAIEQAAGALWQIGQYPLDLTEAEPDFISGPVAPEGR